MIWSSRHTLSKSFFSSLPLVGFLLSCTGQTEPQSSLDAKELVVDSPTTVISSERATDVETLLSEAQELLDEERYEEAARRFELVVQAAQKPSERLRGLWGSGTAWDAAGRPKKALAIYDRYVAEAPEGAKRDEIRVRQVRLFTFMEDYQAAARAAARVETEQAPLSKVAILAALALFALEEDRDRDAELAIARARSIIEEEDYDRLGTIPRDVAALYFSLGELRRKKAEAIQFDPMPEDFAAALEARCQWILDAQSAYSQAMRAKDAHWSAMAGVAVGELYRSLHQELMEMPQPVTADTEQRRELFEGALRLRYSILLTKAASMLRATLALREKDQARGVWVHRAEEALLAIEEAQREEEQALSSLPYTKAQLQQALDDLASRATETVGQN